MSLLSSDSELTTRILRAGLSGNGSEFRAAAQELGAIAEAAGDRSLSSLIASLSGERGRVETAMTESEKAAAFSATLSDENEIPVGLSLVKTNVLMEHVILPDHVKQVVGEFLGEQDDNALYIENGLVPRNKMMLMGPPGNGKTALSKAIANRMGCPLYFVRYDQLMSTKQGETSRRLGTVFEFVKSHRCILFFDEVDAIGKERSDDNEAGDMKRVVSNLLVQLDDVPPHVIVLGATNHPQMLDKAIWRRFHIRVLLPNPSTDEFHAYLKLAYARYKHHPTGNLRILALRLEAENFAETEVFVEDSIRTFIRERGRVDIDEAIKISIANWPRTRVKIPT